MSVRTHEQPESVELVDVPQDGVAIEREGTAQETAPTEPAPLDRMALATLLIQHLSK